VSLNADAWNWSSAACISSPPASGGKERVRMRMGVRYSRSREETEAAELKESRRTGLGG